jgi:acyl transferase domain-containing protein/protein-L-isoaspartate O-methyltransferase/acyl carrier protein
MQEFIERIKTLSPQRLALLAIDLQAKLEAAERTRTEPIAIIGMACRFPGANTPEAYWEMLRDGVDAITEIPPTRWNNEAYYDPDPDAPGKIATRWGGFVEPIDGFEPQFFGIAPREALGMDPQQRMLLEVSWEAVERAGYAPQALGAAPTGVFVGICNSDFGQMRMGGDETEIDAYLSTGNAHSIASGRLSYTLGLQGPSLSVDTACSSSLVAIHLAMQSLRMGECRTALAGGVNAILSPVTTITLSRARMMASDGRCKAFDARADGFVRSEGCGMVVLKRLRDAIADKDRVLAVLRGSALNQDGRSNGITAPNGPSQISVIRAALANAGLAPSDVQYVETHGTGTSLGDPIELQALGAALGAGRDGAAATSADAPGPLLIGSVKTNIGHLESAAGVAGLMKLVLMLEHGEIPPHLHLQERSPHIAWDEYAIEIPTERTPWPMRNGRRVAGISSFGFSGTNAHLLIESAPEALSTHSTADEQGPHLFTLSARTLTALRTLAGIYADYFAEQLAEHPDLSPATVAYTANTARVHLTHRLALTADSLAEMRDHLAAFAEAGRDEGISTGIASGSGRPPLAFLFTGQGANHGAMGQALYAAEATFRAALDDCGRLLAPHVDRSLQEILFGPESENLLARVEYAQPALCALQVALAALWRAWGIEPDVVAGHSAGEYGAAIVAGVMELEDGLKLSALRGRLMARTADSAGSAHAGAVRDPGAMAALFAGEAQVTAAIATCDVNVSIAAVNGPENLVISGGRDAVRAVVDALQSEGVQSRTLAVAVAAHSPYMDNVLDEFELAVRSVTLHPPHTPFISGMTGRVATPAEVTDARYWRRQMREPVRFDRVVESLRAREVGACVEIGPHPTLISNAQRAWPDAAVIWVPSLRMEHPEVRQMRSSLGALFAGGIQPDWQGYYGSTVRPRALLPTYPFERQRYPIEAAPRRTMDAHDRVVHPLLGAQVESPALEATLFQTALGAQTPAFLSDHRIYGAALLPSPAYIEMALAAGAQVYGNKSCAVEDLSIREALLLPEEGAIAVQSVLAVDGEIAQFQIYSRPQSEGSWVLNASGRIAAQAAPVQGVPWALGAVQERCSERIDAGAYYARLAQLGLEFGPAFQGLTQIWRRDGEALGMIELPATLEADAARYNFHPALLDACFHLLGAPLPADAGSALLVGIDHLQFQHVAEARLWCHVQLRPGYREGDTFVGDLRVYTERGALVAEALGLHLKRATRAALLQATHRHANDWFYALNWEEQAPPEEGHKTLPDAQTLADAIGQQVAPLAETYGLEAAQAHVAGIEALSTAYALQALARLGWMPRAGETMTTAALADQLGIIPAQQRLFARLLAIAAEEGLLHADQDATSDSPGAMTWTATGKIPAVGDPAAMEATLRSGSVPAQPELALIARCGPALAQVLRGEVDALPLLFPNGSLALTEPLYRDTPAARLFNTLIGEAVHGAVKQAQPDAQRPLRILEIGAGSGGTTAYILPRLPAEGVEYWFTDVSPHFTARAQENFSEHGFMRYARFDVEHAPLAQGLPAAPFDSGFDIVIAANVLHATANLRTTLAHVRSTLAPGGLLILFEGIRPRRWVDITFGLTDGWWRFTDYALRPNHPLLGAAAWRDLLAATGFDGVAAVPPEDATLDQVILLARTAEKHSDPANTPWLLFTSEEGASAQIVAWLQEQGVSVDTVVAGNEFAQIAERRWSVDPTSSESYRQLLAALPAASAQRQILYLWPLDLEPSSEQSAEALLAAAENLCAGAVALAQALDGDAGKLWLVTRNGQAVPQAAKATVPPNVAQATVPPNVAQATVPPNVAQATLWGIGRGLSLEMPQQWGGLLDLDGGCEAQSAAAWLLHAVQNPGDDDALALRDGRTYAPRLVRTAPPPAAHANGFPTLRVEGAYLITGGLGGLGLPVAQRLARDGAGCIVLLGRSGLPPRAEWPMLPATGRIADQVKSLQAVEALGARVEVVAADVADRTAMRALFARFGADLPHLRGIVHAAADLSNWPVGNLPMDALRAQLRPKTGGGWLLHELSSNLKLDFFVLFSSTTALWGAQSLAHYAAANQSLDALAHYRRARGLPALAINWGTWDQMRFASEAERRNVVNYGMNLMESGLALDALGALMASDTTQVVVASIDWQRLRASYEARRARPLFTHVQPIVHAAPPVDSKQPAATRNRPLLQERLAELPDNASAEERSEVVANFVREMVDQVLGAGRGQVIDDRQGLFEMGMDSLMAIELKGKLEVAVAEPLPSTLTFNYPNVAALTGYLLEKLHSSAPPSTRKPEGNGPAQPSPAQTGRAADELSEDELAERIAAKLARLK